MDGKEINDIMSEYTEAIKSEWGKANDYIMSHDDIDEMEVFDNAKTNAHKVAVQCLDKILSPELKIFIKNLCYNRLGYPDEPIFYKVFGEYPKGGDKVSRTGLEEKGIDLDEFEGLIDEKWFFEGNFVSIEKTDGETYYVIDSLFNYPQTDSEEEWELLRNSMALKKYVLRDNNIDEKTKQGFMDLFNKAIPMLGKMNM